MTHFNRFVKRSRWRFYVNILIIIDYYLPPIAFTINYLIKFGPLPRMAKQLLKFLLKVNDSGV